MTLINRVVRLFRADFNAVLDKLEEPDVLLRQAIRDMEESLYQDKQQLKLLANEYSNNEQRINELNKKLDDVANEMDICFESGDDNLARNQVRRKLEYQQMLAVLNKKQEQLSKTCESLEEKIATNKTRYLSMKQKLEIFNSTSGDIRTNEDTSLEGISEHDIQVAFLQEKKARRAS